MRVRTQDINNLQISGYPLHFLDPQGFCLHRLYKQEGLLRRRDTLICWTVNKSCKNSVHPVFVSCHPCWGWEFGHIAPFESSLFLTYTPTIKPPKFIGSPPCSLVILLFSSALSYLFGVRRCLCTSPQDVCHTAQLVLIQEWRESKLNCEWLVIWSLKEVLRYKSKAGLCKGGTSVREIRVRLPVPCDME